MLGGRVAPSGQSTCSGLHAAEIASTQAIVHIAVVTNLLPPTGHGGAELYVASLAAELALRHEVTVFSGSPDPVPGVRVVGLPHTADMSPDTSAPVKALWHTRDLWRPSVLGSLVRHLRSGSFDVVHTHSPQGLSSAVLSAAGRARLPHVHTAHDFNAICMRTSLTREGTACDGACLACRPQRVVRGTLLRRHVDVLITASEYVRRRHLEAGVAPGASATVIRYGAEPGSPRTPRKPGAPLRLGFIGTLGAHKGVDTLLRAFARASPDWRLAIAGSGPLEDRCRGAAARDPRIDFQGRVDGSAKDAFLAGLDILVVPSEWEEPSGIVAIEAAVRGVPAVVSDRGGLPEHPEAIAFPSGDAQGLLDAVSRLARDDRLEGASRRLLEARGPMSRKRSVSAVEGVLERASQRDARDTSS